MAVLAATADRMVAVEKVAEWMADPVVVMVADWVAGWVSSYCNVKRRAAAAAAVCNSRIHKRFAPRNLASYRAYPPPPWQQPALFSPGVLWALDHVLDIPIMIVTAGFAVVVFARYLPRPIAPHAEALGSVQFRAT